MGRRSVLRAELRHHRPGARVRPLQDLLLLGRRRGAEERGVRGLRRHPPGQEGRHRGLEEEADAQGEGGKEEGEGEEGKEAAEEEAATEEAAEEEAATEEEKQELRGRK